VVSAAVPFRGGPGLSGRAVPDAAITVEESHPVWVTVDPTEPMPLGEQCVLGGGFFDCGNSVRVLIRPTSPASVRSLMPGQRMHEDVMHLLRFYLGYEAQAVIVMHVSPDLMPPPVLESQAVNLGYTTLLPRADTHAPSDNTPIQIQLGTWPTPACR
jgi:type VI secretion system protein ImpH